MKWVSEFLLSQLRDLIEDVPKIGLTFDGFFSRKQSSILKPFISFFSSV